MKCNINKIKQSIKISKENNNGRFCSTIKTKLTWWCVNYGLFILTFFILGFVSNEGVVIIKRPVRGGGIMKKILLVDDEYSFLQILDIALSKYFETYIAAGVQEALEVLDKSTVDIICSDLYMRDGTGLELLQIVKKRYGSVPFILLSGSEKNLDIRMAEHYGATFIPKGEFNFINRIISMADNSRHPTK